MDDLTRANIKAGWDALRMIREAIEELFPEVAQLESSEAVLLRGPEPHHEAEAIIEALQRVADALPPHALSVPPADRNSEQ